MNREELYNKFIDKYGFDSQLIVAQEEFAELIAAISRYRRIWIDKRYEKKCITDNLFEEIADCKIMLEQLIMHFGWEQIEKHYDNKLKRMENKVQP